LNTGLDLKTLKIKLSKSLLYSFKFYISIPNRKTRIPRTMGCAFLPKRLAKFEAPNPRAQARNVAKPLYKPLLKVPPA
jgi:hypothetical protein